MTANDPRHLTHHPYLSPAQLTKLSAVAGGGDDSDTNTVPIIVWRTAADSTDTDNTGTDTGTGVSSQLAWRLVTIYTQHGQTVVDFDADTNLRDAADAAGRGYMSITSPAELADLDTLNKPVGLVLWRWPRADKQATPDAVTALFTACQLILAGEGTTMVAFTAAPPGQPGTTYAEHAGLLLPAATAAGLDHVHDIVAVTATDGRDAFTYYATQHEADTGGRDSGADTPRQDTAANLLIFTTRAGTP